MTFCKPCFRLYEQYVNFEIKEVSTYTNKEGSVIHITLKCTLSDHFVMLRTVVETK